ncbi:complex I NDUFA9 subunit family protein [Sphingosinicella humi]|uniref:complex I NDUFA9 subunit family protein n=1 Tax=Allosphingosinicella humi TaxID=2068657 RepID=UPI001FB09343|nr:complex I NDUFA9 subunit family protein [Sphingosinicella humi]
MQKLDRLVTLFGGGGFIGRYVAQALYRTGVRVRIAQRDPRQAFFLKPLGGLGQTHFVACDIRKPEQVAAAVASSDAVVNLVGVFKNPYAVNVDGARNIAEAAREAGVHALVHFSAIGADPSAKSDYGRSKGEGEDAVRAAFPGVTVVRPSIVFGQEDNFVNRFAALARLLPVVPVIKGDTKFQPVYVADVGRAVSTAALDPRTHGGKTYELGGPEVMTMRTLNQRICEATGRSRPLLDVPDALASAMAGLFGWLPGAPMTWDQWLMLQHDNVVSPGAKGLNDLGVAPTPLAAVTPEWLTSYRRHGRFAVKSPY